MSTKGLSLHPLPTWERLTSADKIVKNATLYLSKKCNSARASALPDAATRALNDLAALATQVALPAAVYTDDDIEKIHGVYVRLLLTLTNYIPYLELFAGVGPWRRDGDAILPPSEDTCDEVHEIGIVICNAAIAIANEAEKTLANSFTAEKVKYAFKRHVHATSVLNVVGTHEYFTSSGKNIMNVVAAQTRAQFEARTRFHKYMFAVSSSRPATPMNDDNEAKDMSSIPLPIPPKREETLARLSVAAAGSFAALTSSSYGMDKYLLARSAVHHARYVVATDKDEHGFPAYARALGYLTYGENLLLGLTTAPPKASETSRSSWSFIPFAASVSRPEARNQQSLCPELSHNDNAAIRDLLSELHDLIDAYHRENTAIQQPVPTITAIDADAANDGVRDSVAAIAVEWDISPFPASQDPFAAIPATLSVPKPLEAAQSCAKQSLSRAQQILASNQQALSTVLPARVMNLIADMCRTTNMCADPLTDAAKRIAHLSNEAEAIKVLIDIELTEAYGDASMPVDRNKVRTLRDRLTTATKAMDGLKTRLHAVMSSNSNPKHLLSVASQGQLLPYFTECGQCLTGPFPGLVEERASVLQRTRELQTEVRNHEAAVHRYLTLVAGQQQQQQHNEQHHSPLALCDEIVNRVVAHDRRVSEFLRRLREFWERGTEAQWGIDVMTAFLVVWRQLETIKPSELAEIKADVRKVIDGIASYKAHCVRESAVPLAVDDGKKAPKTGGVRKGKAPPRPRVSSLLQKPAKRDRDEMDP